MKKKRLQRRESHFPHFNSQIDRYYFKTKMKRKTKLMRKKDTNFRHSCRDNFKQTNFFKSEMHLSLLRNTISHHDPSPENQALVSSPPLFQIRCPFGAFDVRSNSLPAGCLPTHTARTTRGRRHFSFLRKTAQTNIFLCAVPLSQELKGLRALETRKTKLIFSRLWCTYVHILPF